MLFINSEQIDKAAQVPDASQASCPSAYACMPISDAWSGEGRGCTGGRSGLKKQICMRRAREYFHAMIAENPWPFRNTDAAASLDVMGRRQASVGASRHRAGLLTLYLGMCRER